MPVSIRSRLLLLVLALLMPGMLGVAWLIATTFRAERESNSRMLRDVARAVSLVVDQELSRRALIASVLANSYWLDESPLAPEQLAAFDRRARLALQGIDGWLELRAPGRILLDTRASGGLVDRPAAGPLEQVPLTRPLQPAREGEPAHAQIVQPVRRDGRTVYNLIVTIRPEELQRIIDAQRLDREWLSAVIDNAGNVVAAHPQGGRLVVGQPAPPELRAQVAALREHHFESTALDSRKTRGYFSTSALGWTYLSAIPRESYGGWLPRAVWQTSIGAALLLALAVAGAMWVARRIVRPVQALEQAAARLRTGQPVPPLQATGIGEFDDVSRALADASTAIRLGRDELERQVADAVQRTRQAEQRVSQSQRIEALGRLTGGVAHDFNNLLGVVSNSAHLMQRHPVAAAELQAPLAATLRAVQVGSQLTQHLLRFAGRRPLRMQEVQLTQYLPELHELISSVLGRRILMSVEVATDTAAVRVDAGEFELALVNLALNARDAMPTGGELRVKARNASADEAGGLPAGRYVLVTVGDNGVGIQPEQAEHLFEPFFTTKAVGQGTGLGLSQVHGFCTQAGGAARIAGTPGLGTTVSLLLPASDGSPGASPAALPQPSIERGLDGVRVLLAEDNPALCETAQALLAAHGAQVHCAGDAAEALDIALAGEVAFDVVLSDIVMPGKLDGLALARELRRHKPELPVVLITGFSDAVDPVSREFVVLRKPCGERELVAALQQAANRHRPG